MRKSKAGVLFVLLALCCVVRLRAAGETIYEIKVRGIQKVARELVTSSLSFGVGDYLDPEEVAKSIKQLHKLGMFSDIRVFSEPYESGVNLIIEVSENPVLAFLEFDGFKVLKQDKLSELVSVRPGSFWSSEKEQQIKRKLTQEYHSKGYSNAQIQLTQLPTEDGKVIVKLRAIEGERLALRAITLVGNEFFEDQALLKRMKTKPANLIRSGRFEQEKFDADLVKLTGFYKKNGFVDVKIGPYELKQTGDRSLELVLNIREGSKYELGEIRVSGNASFTTEAILGKITLKPGESFDAEKFQAQVAGVYSLYYDEGYIYAEINPVEVKSGNRLNIELQISEGTRARVRQIFLTGNQRTKEKVLRRQLDIAPGDWFRQSQWMRTQQNIYNLGFFEPEIGLDYQPINNNGDIDLTVKVTDKSSGMANGGVGYNSQDKFVGQLSINQNNLFGNNWSSSLAWEFGGSTQNFEFSFTNPNLFDSDLLLGTSLYYTQKDWSSFYYQISTRGASLRLGQFLPLIDRTRLVAGYSLYSKKYRITNMDKILENEAANATLIELDSLDWRYTSALSTTLSRDTRDNIFFPMRGSQFTLFSELAGGLLGGDFDYFKQIAQVNWYMETLYKITLRTKWRFGYITPYGRSGDAPPDEKFYLGGTGVDGIRGYPDRSIGPEGGGSRELIFSTELAYPIGSDQIIGVGFFDAGDSFNKLREFNFLNLKKGVGAGIRIRSPFGLIGFDYAYNLEDGSWEPHLQFGTTF